jgi:dTDP-4-amino-4,6-dideoxygalactose transaminase
MDLLLATLSSVLSDGRLKLETALQNTMKRRSVILTPSARAGLYLLFRAIDRPRVVVPAYTCNAVVEAAHRAGKTVDFVPLESEGFQADLLRTAEIAAPDCIILMTHQFGQLVDIDAYRRVAEQTGALLIEDAAAAQGGRYGESVAGASGMASVVSFEGSKIVHGPVHGGAITTDDPSLAGRLESMAAAEFTDPGWWNGLKYWGAAFFYAALSNPVAYRIFHFFYFQLQGRTSGEKLVSGVTNLDRYRQRMQSWQAHLVCRQLLNLSEITARRREIFNRYRSGLTERGVSRIPNPVGVGDACARFVFCCTGDRGRVLRRAAAKGIDFGVAFSCIEAPEQFHVEHEVARSIINLPLYPQLSDDNIQQVLDVVNTLLCERAA